MATVRAAMPADFAAIHPLLLDFANSAMTREDWRRMLFDPPWPVEEPTRGYLLEDGGQAVGFLGTIFSARDVRGTLRRFCNLSSWVVREDYRASSLQLLLPVLGLRTHTIVNLSASARAHEIFRGLGFRPLEDRQVLLPPIARIADLVAWPGAQVTTDFAAIAAALDPAGRRIAVEMVDTRAAQVLIRRGTRSCHAIAVRSPWKRGLFLAHVQYASDWELLLECVPQATAGFFPRLRTVGLRVDGRRIAGPVPQFGVMRPLALPTLYRPAESDLSPNDVDGLYTELVLQRW